MFRNLNLWLALVLLMAACQPTAKEESTPPEEPAEDVMDNFNWNPENVADKKILRYQIPGFDKLSLSQKKLVYFLTQAGLAGRDIMYDMNYRHNLAVRHAIDQIARQYDGDKSSADWKAFMEYAKNVWFSSGIHHHYSNDKFKPGFSQAYFSQLMSATGATLNDEALQAIFDPEIDARKLDKGEGKDIVKSSAVNFYDPDITQAEVEAFYAKRKKALGDKVSTGLNSKVVRNANGQLEEKVWKADGLYGPAISEIIKWLEKAVEVAENQAQGDALKLLIEYYRTGDLKTWDDYNIAWVQATEGDIDYINSFIEVYQDPMGLKGSFESVVQIKDFEASARMEKVAANAQWFEDHAPFLDQHKKKEVSGISYKVVTVAGEGGDASPSSAIGVNLPNADWIRKDYGSKSVSLGNIVEAYGKADGPGLLLEFANDKAEIEMANEYGALASKIHTALHEVVGHASGQLEAGVGTPGETLIQYASPLEEARADLVALYFMMDPKLIELGLYETLDVGKAAYDSYLKNGLMLQLRRIEPGKTIQQAHMLNRAMVAHWVYERGSKSGAVVMEKREGKTYIDIKDYDKIRELFGELLREVQRIKSQGDFEAGKKLIEDYGVKVDAAIHSEVLARSEKLNIPPYGGFINPRLVPVTDDKGEITDIKVEYPDDFAAQMLEYAEHFSFLPLSN